MADGVSSLAGPETSRTVPRADEIHCPHCGQTNPKLAGSGALVDCQHCDRSFAQPRTPLLAPGSLPGNAASASLSRSATDVGMRTTGLIAALLTLVFYAALVIPLSGSYVADLFGARGWVPYGITWLSVWAGVLLVVKAQLLRRQQRSLELDLLPDALAARITPTNAPDFRAHLQALASGQGTRLPLPASLVSSTSRDFLIERVDNALERFRMRRSAPDVVEHLASQSQLDANAVASSYTMVRVFIWAIPLLGFIGTVIGISAAVAGFSDSVAAAVDLDVMKQSIGSVTTGLGVAFDTTLLALVMSIVIMFPASSLQKAEEDFLNRVEAYCDEQLGRRLDDGSAESSPQPAGLEALQAQISRLADSIQALDGKLTRND